MTAPHIFRFPLDDMVVTESLPFFLSNVRPADSETWEEFLSNHADSPLCGTNVRELASRIERGAQMEPVLVGFGVDGVPRVFNGQHRVAAHLLANAPLIQYQCDEPPYNPAEFVHLTLDVPYLGLESEPRIDELWETLRAIPVPHHLSLSPNEMRHGGWISIQGGSGSVHGNTMTLLFSFHMFNVDAETTAALVNETLQPHGLHATIEVVDDE